MENGGAAKSTSSDVIYSSCGLIGNASILEGVTGPQMTVPEGITASLITVTILLLMKKPSVSRADSSTPSVLMI